MSTPVNAIYHYSPAVYDAKLQASESTEAVEAEQEASPVSQTDVFVKSPQYKPDLEKINAMNAGLSNNMAAFRKMVQALFKNQGNVSSNAMNQLLEIDRLTQEQAQQAISEEGEWGVEKTAQRILDFAKAISGGDSSKIDSLRSAVKEGFAAAEKMWGGSLPDISHRTLERVMQGFDEWANEGTAEA